MVLLSCILIFFFPFLINLLLGNVLVSWVVWLERELAKTGDANEAMELEKAGTGVIPKIGFGGENYIVI